MNFCKLEEAMGISLRGLFFAAANLLLYSNIYLVVIVLYSVMYEYLY